MLSYLLNCMPHIISYMGIIIFVCNDHCLGRQPLLMTWWNVVASLTLGNTTAVCSITYLLFYKTGWGGQMVIYDELWKLKVRYCKAANAKLRLNKMHCTDMKQWGQILTHLFVKDWFSTIQIILFSRNYGPLHYITVCLLIIYLFMESLITSWDDWSLLDDW